MSVFPFTKYPKLLVMYDKHVVKPLVVPGGQTGTTDPNDITTTGIPPYSEKPWEDDDVGDILDELDFDKKASELYPDVEKKQLPDEVIKRYFLDSIKNSAYRTVDEISDIYETLKQPLPTPLVNLIEEGEVEIDIQVSGELVFRG